MKPTKISTDTKCDMPSVHHASFDKQISIKTISRQLGKIKGNVLDFGCGTSLFAQILRNENTIYFGLDANYQILKLQTDDVLKNEDISNHFLINANNVPFRTDSFSFIFCFHVLEHLDKRDIKRIVRDFYRVLEPNSMLALGVPVMGLCGRAVFRLRTFTGHIDPHKHIDHTRDEDHKCVFTIEDIVSICKEAGFIEIKKRRISNLRIVNILSKFFNVESMFLSHLITKFKPLFDTLMFFKKKE